MVAEIVGFGQAAGQRHCVFDKGICYAIAVGIDKFIGHRLGLFGYIAKVGTENFNFVIRSTGEALYSDRAAGFVHGVLNGVTATPACFSDVDLGLKAGEASLDIAECVGADAFDF